MSFSKNQTTKKYNKNKKQPKTIKKIRKNNKSSKISSSILYLTKRNS